MLDYREFAFCHRAEVCLLLYVKLLDENGDSDTPVFSEKIHGNLLYVADAPVDGASTSSGIMSLTSASSPSGEDVRRTDEGKAQIVNIQKNSSTGKHHTQNSYSDNYKHADATTDATQLAFDSTNSFLNFRTSTSGIVETSVDSSGVITSTGNTYTQSNAKSYSFMRAISNNTLYGIEEESTNNAYLYFTRPNYSSSSSSSESSSRETDFGSETSSDTAKDKLPFILCEDSSDATKCDMDAKGKPLTHTKTIAFDYGEMYDGNSYAAVAYSDGKNVRVRVASDSGISSITQVRFGGDSPIRDIKPQFLKDIRFLTDQKSASTDGLIGILDNQNKKVWLVHYNTDSASKKLSFDSSKYLTTGNNPVAMVIDNDKRTLTILNAGDESLSFFSLKNSDGTARSSPLSIGKVKLKSYLRGENIKFKPNSLILSDSTLLVGGVRTKSYLTIPFTNTIKKMSATLTDEAAESSSEESAEAVESSNTSTESLSTSKGNIVDNLIKAPLKSIPSGIRIVGPSKTTSTTTTEDTPESDTEDSNADMRL